MQDDTRHQNQNHGNAPAGRYRQHDAYGSRTRYEHDSPARIEQEIRQTRSQIDETLDELEGQLQPRQIARDVWDWASDIFPERENLTRSLSRAGRNISRRVQAHPIPAGLIGAGLIWLLSEEATGRSIDTDDIRRGFEKGRDRAEDLADSARGSIQHATESVRSRVQSAADATRHSMESAEHRASSFGSSVSTRGHSAVDRASEGISHASRRAGHAARQAADATANAYDRNPVVFGLLACVGGLAAGLSLSNTRAERRAFGETGKMIRERAREAGSHALSEVADAAEEAVHTAEDKANEGLDRAEEATERAEQTPSQSAR